MAPKTGNNPAGKTVVEIRSAGFYEKNMRVLKEYHPDVYEAVENVTSERGGRRYFVRSSPSGMPNLWLEEANRYFYDHDNPAADARRRVKELNLKNTRLAVFLGVGLGYELNYFLRDIAPKQRTEHVLIVEKDPALFRELLKIADLTHLFKEGRFCFLIGVEEDRLFVRLRSYLSEKQRFLWLKAMNPVYHPSSMLLAKGYYLNVLKNLREAAVHEILNYGNSPHDSLVGVANMLANIGEIVSNPGINLLYGKFKGRPAVVVATGPSLNKNKHLLKGLEEKALIIAADASLRVLINMGVKPHLVTSLERVLPTVKLLEGFSKEEVEDVYLAACPVVRPEMYQVYPGPRIIVYRDFDHFRWLGIERGILPIQLSAGNMAFKVAEALGCDPIILIGQDLAFARDGRTHASGTVYGERQAVASQQNDLLEVMGNDGQPILTNRTWYSFLKGYEIDLAGYKGRCINSTEGGAYIRGTEVMPFAEAIKKFIGEEFRPLQIIRENLSQFSKAEVQSDLEKLEDLLDDTLQDLKNIKTECEKGISLIQEHQEEISMLAGSEGPDRKKKAEKQLAQLEKEILAPKAACIVRYNRTFQLFLAHIIQSYAIKFEMEMRELPEKYGDQIRANAEVLLQHERWYRVIGEITDICTGLLREASAKLAGVRAAM